MDDNRQLRWWVRPTLFLVMAFSAMAVTALTAPEAAEARDRARIILLMACLAAFSLGALVVAWLRNRSTGKP